MNPSQNIMVTQGTFQDSTPSYYILSQLNANTGQRNWGTYLGPNATEYGVEFCGIEADDQGVYILGFDGYENSSGYFGTLGAYKPQKPGDADLFLSKFSPTGRRVWSTYIGTPNPEGGIRNAGLSLHNGKLCFTGIQVFSSHNIATPGAYQDVPPSVGTSDNYVNPFFGMMSTDGAMEWISYYGGSNAGYVSNAAHVWQSPQFMNDGSLILFGAGSATEGITTPNAAFPTCVAQSYGASSYLVKFNPNSLGVNESQNNSDIKLYDNPNDGKFSLEGKALNKIGLKLNKTDMSGRNIYTQNLPASPKVEVDLSHQLTSGKYLIRVKSPEKEIYNSSFIVK